MFESISPGVERAQNDCLIKAFLKAGVLTG
jgi:hypothetical protein